MAIVDPMGILWQLHMHARRSPDLTHIYIDELERQGIPRKVATDLVWEGKRIGREMSYVRWDGNLTAANDPEAAERQRPIV